MSPIPWCRKTRKGGEGLDLKRKAVSGVLLILLLMSILTPAFNIPSITGEDGTLEISVSDYPDPFSPLYEQNTITITNAGTILLTEVILSIDGIDREWRWKDVFSSISVHAIWDGKDGDGHIVALGTYTYTALAYGNGWSDTEKGTITVVLSNTAQDVSWSFDSEFQCNLDNNYETIEVAGHWKGTAILHDEDLFIIQGEITINVFGDPLEIGEFPSFYLIATDGTDKELANQIIDPSHLGDFILYEIGPNTFGFSGQGPVVIKPINNGHYEVSAQITYDNEKYHLLVNTFSRINSHYLPLTTITNILPVPYYYQGDTAWCMPTSMSMIFKYYGNNIHSWDIAKDWGWSRDVQWEKFCDPSSRMVRDYFNTHGLVTEDGSNDFDTRP